MANTTNWLSISSQSGSSGQTILTLSANKNLSAGTKTAEITAYNPVYNISAKTYVTIDAYSPYIYVSDSIIGIPASGGTYQLGIESNCSFVIAYPNMVSSYSTSAGTGNISVTFSVPATYQSQTITENIVITDESGQYSIVVRLEQYGSEPEISAVPPELLFEANGGTLYFTVSANCVYHIDNSVISGWCGVSPQSGYTGSTTFTVTTTANTGDSAKTGIIAVVGPGTAGDMVQVRQKRTTVQIPYTADTSTIEASGETRTITIDTTGLVDSSITVDIQNAPGATYTYSNGVITLTIPDNSGSTRDVVVSVAGKTTGGDDAATSITFPQAEHTTGPLPYTADTSTVDASGETRTITIDASNLVASSITIGVEGTTGATYTYQNGIITIEFPRNKTPNQKNITVTVSGETITGNEAEATISYVQNTGAIYEIPYTADTSTVNETGETRYIYIDCSQLISSSITVSSSGIPGTIVSYDSATCIVTVAFPNSSISGYELLPDTITIEGETINGNYAYAFVYYEQAGTDISALPMTFVIKTDGYIRWGQMNTVTTSSKEISYSKNGGDWVKIKSSVVPLDCPKIDVVAGDVLRFKANNTTYGSGSYGNAHFQNSTADYDVYGNIMSMMYGDDFSGQTALTGTFSEFFSGEGIHSAKSLILPATEVKYGCYSSMFQSCRKMTETPSLPATLININGGPSYAHMFAYCTSLKKVPRLPAIMSIGIYNSGPFAYMFEGCSGLTTIPYDYLPRLAQGVEIGTRLPPSCFAGMFKGCSSLVETPELHYTILGDNCYSAMFEDCTSLVTPPALPATTFIKYGSTIANGCYESMFKDCISLATAPALPITEVGDYSYASMFSGCTSLTQAPELPATILGDRCYRWMFAGCTGLTDAPVLPAETIKMRSYDLMFYHCTNISAITCLATNVTNVEDEEGYIMQWVTGVAPAGKFIKKWNVNWPIGDNGIPSGWVTEESLPTDSILVFGDAGGNSAFTFTTLSNWSATTSDSWILLNQATGVSGITNLTITVEATNTPRTGTVTITDKYSTTVFTIEQDSYRINPLTFKIISGGTIKWGAYTGTVDAARIRRRIQYKKNDGSWTDILSNTGSSAPSINVAANDIIQFRGDNLNYSDIAKYDSYNSFKGSTASFTIEGNIMSLINSTGFTTAETLNPNYQYTFINLFSGCTGLTSVENLLLPATALTYGCYQGMFSHCTSLQTAPVLPALVVPSNGYYKMFDGCTNLNYIKCLATNISANSCTYNWVKGVASTGTFVKNPNMSSWATGNYGIPSGWTVQDAT